MATIKKLVCLCALASMAVMATASDASACHKRRCNSGCQTAYRGHGHGCRQSCYTPTYYTQTCYSAPTYAYNYAPAPAPYATPQYAAPQAAPSGQVLPPPPAPSK